MNISNAARRPVLLLVAIATLAFLSGYVWKNYTIRAQDHPPFTAYMLEVSRNSEQGPVVHSRHFLYAVRGDKAKVYANLLLSEDGSYTTVFRNVTLPASSKKLFVSESGKLVSSFLNQSFNLTPNVSGSCPIAPDHTQIGETSLQGVRAVGTRIDDARLRREVWRAPELDCFVVRSKTEYKNNDGSIRMVTEKMLTTVSFGEPDARLFEAGSHYREVAPSELYEQAYEAAGMAADSLPGVQQKLQQIDTSYANSRTPKKP